MDLLILAVLAVITFITGSLIEKNHYRSIRKREKELLHIPIINNHHHGHVLPAAKKNLVDMLEQPNAKVNLPIERIELVMGSVVLGVDFFKVLLSGLRSIFGGGVASLESITDRARREAVLRMREAAKDADAISNMRIETAALGQSQVEVVAYGTAIYLKKDGI